ncbi:hypothetical protein [Streptosporangium sp. NPDC087985]|uniref:hypothetical protein n=1 Tax=Streptosporangium sp. NPDC087985 TaxID=3366196 RepID=UPI00381F87EE
MQTPTVGRIVHYVSHGTPPRPDGTQAFTSQCRAAIVYCACGWIEASHRGGTWHWPERVDAPTVRVENLYIREPGQVEPEPAEIADLPGLTVDLLMHEVEVDGEMVVSVPDRTRDALIALGWTPPAEPRPDDVATTYP